MELDYLKIKINGQYEFSYPKNESEMIFSVLKGKDYPLANVKIKSVHSSRFFFLPVMNSLLFTKNLSSTPQ